MRRTGGQPRPGNEIASLIRERLSTFREGDAPAEPVLVSTSLVPAVRQEPHPPTALEEMDALPALLEGEEVEV